ncbi:MAG TPA: ABC transporter ATP-binding protein [Candidatus Micrarchaeia archaeon]|nr:ABC transporter ATP-binding protein [Candidatus Micrarchaeia archaeon]
MTAVDSWRGVAAEQTDDLPPAATLFLRARSRRLLGGLLRPHRAQVALLLGLVVTENLARLATPVLVKVGIDSGIPPVLHGRGAAVLIEVSAAMLIAVVAQAACHRAFILLSGRIGQHVLLELRRRLFDHFQQLSVSFHERYTSGRVISRLTSDVDAITTLLETGVEDLISAVLVVLGTGVLLLVLDWPLGLVTLATFPVLLWMAAWFRRESARAYRRTREAVALLIVHFVESMRGIRAVQGFRREARNQSIFEAINDRYRLANQRSFRLVAVFTPGVRLVGNLVIGVVLLYGGYRVLHGQMTVGVLAAFLLYVGQFFEPMQDITDFYNTFQAASAALEKLSGVLEERPQVASPAHPRTPAAVVGALQFDGVRFGYRDQVVLEGLDLSVPAGQTLAVVGATGAGKTTLARLATRFYDPTRGSIRLDGIDLREWDETRLRSQVVMVTQDGYLFSGTVADNIAFGRPDASRDEMVAAARAVGADRFIEHLPGGYDTDVGKHGGRFSAGQRQLMAFARAFLADPKVLILDEATASLDVPSERLVQRALRTVLSRRTALIIAHRLTTVEIADRVIVLDRGRIVEDGRPRDLLAGPGRYRDLHRAWRASLA